MGRWWLDSLPRCILAIRWDCFVDWKGVLCVVGLCGQDVGVCFKAVSACLDCPFWQVHLQHRSVAETCMRTLLAVSLQLAKVHLHECGWLYIRLQWCFHVMRIFCNISWTTSRKILSMKKLDALGWGCILKSFKAHVRQETAFRTCCWGNCQTFASDFFTLLTGQEAVPTQAFCHLANSDQHCLGKFAV